MIETEKLLIIAVKEELKRRGFKGKFSSQSHFFGYEGRAGLPSNFDTQYCYALGHTAALLIDEELTGYMTCVSNLTRPVSQWSVEGLPITMLMNLEVRKGEEKPVIQKALVDLESKPFAFFAGNREEWAVHDHYCYPGPIQFFGDIELVNSVPLTMQF
jgi:pyrophosphate--fructose-6-phosphate 1-phosphotransferase